MEGKYTFTTGSEYMLTGINITALFCAEALIIPCSALAVCAVAFKEQRANYTL